MAFPYRVSCFRPIQLFKSHATIFGKQTTSTCENSSFALIQAFFEFGPSSTPTQEQIIDKAHVLCPKLSLELLHASFKRGLQNGIFQAVLPPVINFVTQPLPPNMYVLAQNMDQNPRNAKAVDFLLRLVGGPQSRLFNVWFKANCQPMRGQFNPNAPCQNTVTV